jgi:predicted phosphodiesterase
VIAVVSDIHGNLPALSAVLDRAFALGCDRIISLGDVVGYYAMPGACIDLLKEHDATNIMGNHDYYLVTDSACPRSRLVNELAAFQRDSLTDRHIAWLAKSPSHLIEGGQFFTHGGWNDFLDQYLYHVTAADIPEEAETLFTGHTHVQALLEFGSKRYCNPGSVGQPRDGDPRAAFATIADGAIELHRVPYDIDRMASAMKAAGFPSRVYENLYIGSQIGGRIDSIVRA